MKIAILAGGTGRRLWPVSRKNLPKQFIDFFGTGCTLLQQACEHASKIVAKEDILIITKSIFKDIVIKQLPWLKPEQLLLEPVNRNTAPAAVWAAHRTKIMDGEDCVIAFMPADQLVLNEDKFIESLKLGAEFVSKNDTVLTMGVTPTRPEPGYGYIQVGGSLEVMGDGCSVLGDGCLVVGDSDLSKGYGVTTNTQHLTPNTKHPTPNTKHPTPIFNIKSFVEKPDREFAEMFIQSGEFLWNTGMYMSRAKFFLEQTEAFLPEIMRGADKQSTLSNIEAEDAFIKANYARYPNLSLDISILEKMAKRSVLHSDFGWADLGTWHGIYEAIPKDGDGNVVVNAESNVISEDSHHNIISLQDGKLAIVSNLEGYIVAEKGNVLVICPKGDSSKQIRKFLSLVENDERLSKEV